MRDVTRTPWTDEERAQLRRLNENGLSQSQIGRMMGRTKHSVHRQMASMGLVKSDRHPEIPDRRHSPPGATTNRAPKTTLPPLLSLMDGKQ
jgi:hypothetical protein